MTLLFLYPFVDDVTYVCCCHVLQEATCAFIILVMAVYWVTEALPINVTGLLPVFMFPMFGVMTSVDVACAFFKVCLQNYQGSSNSYELNDHIQWLSE